MRRGFGPKQIVIFLVFAILAASIIGYAMKITMESGPATYTERAESAAAAAEE